MTPGALTQERNQSVIHYTWGRYKFAFHIERKPGGGFAIHSADPNIQSIEGATHEDIESHFAEKLIAFVGKHFMPELSQALAAQGNSGDIKVFVNRKTGFTVNAGSDKSSLGIARDLPLAGSIQPDDAKIEDAKLGDAKATNANFGSVGDAIGNSPITPETTSSWTISRSLLALLIIAALPPPPLTHSKLITASNAGDDI